MPGIGQLLVDISYGGAFYAFVADRKLGLDIRNSTTVSIVDAATRISSRFFLKQFNFTA